MNWIRLMAAGAAIYAVVGCGENDCSSIPGSKMGAGFCKIPGEPEGGRTATAGGQPTSTGGRVAVTFERGGSGGSGGVGVAGGSAGSAPMSGCGNGIPELGEGCDGNCPTECSTGNACFVGVLIGSPDTCDAKCRITELYKCNNSDGCCPLGCDATNDTDCSPAATCGNGKKEAKETCDAGSDKPCLASCDDGDACTVDMMSGSVAACSVMCGHMPAEANAKTKDGCCPPGANNSVDADCDASCGDGVVSGTEACDTKSAKGCPTTCDDMDPCTVDTLTGSACSAKCSHEPVTKNEAGDGCCLPGTTEAEDSDCKFECYDAADCAGGGECKEPNCSGNKCGFKAKTGDCDSGKGTCQSDGSCKAKPRCGDGKVDPGEKCDGNCPKCDDGNACTTDITTGTVETCDLSCAHRNIAAGSSCGSNMRCDSAGKCNGATCGDGVVDPGEYCDGNCPTTCPVGMEECAVNGLNYQTVPCQARCEKAYAPKGSLCWDNRGMCSGNSGDCFHNVWYRACKDDAGCFGNGSCMNHICTIACTSDAQCGAPAIGERGRCLKGVCEAKCTMDNECGFGQQCQNPGANGFCRARFCAGVGCADAGFECVNDGGQLICLPM